MARTDTGSAQRIARATILHADRLDRLVARAQAGERTAYARLVRDTLDEVRAWCAVRVADAPAIAVAARATYVLAHRRLGGYRRDGTFLAWLAGIAREAAGRVAREAAAAAGELDGPEAVVRDRRLAQAVAGADADDVAAERSGQLRTCLERLSPAAQAILARSYLDRVPLDELAREAGKAPSWAATTLARVRATLRECVLGGHRSGGGGEPRFAELVERWLAGQLAEPARPMLVQHLRDPERREELVLQATMHLLLIARLPVAAGGWIGDDERQIATVSAAAAAREEAAAAVMVEVPPGPPGDEPPPAPAEPPRPPRPARPSVVLETEPAPRRLRPDWRWAAGAAAALAVALFALLPRGGAPPALAATVETIDGSLRVAGRDLRRGDAIAPASRLVVAGRVALRDGGGTLVLDGSALLAVGAERDWTLLDGALGIEASSDLALRTPRGALALEGAARLAWADGVLEVVVRDGRATLQAADGPRAVGAGGRILAAAAGGTVALVHAPRAEAALSTLTRRLADAGWRPVVVPASALARWQDAHFARCAALVLLDGVDPAQVAPLLRARAVGVVCSHPGQAVALGLCAPGAEGSGAVAAIDRLTIPDAALAAVIGGEVRPGRGTVGWVRPAPGARALAALSGRGDRIVAATWEAAAPARRAVVLLSLRRAASQVAEGEWGLFVHAVRSVAGRTDASPTPP